MVSYTVKIFSVLKDRFGSSELEITAGQATTVEELLSAGCTQFPLLQSYRPYIRVAINQKYSASVDPVSIGDEVAFLMPASGG